MSRVIAYDLARLFIGPIFATPRGIDRVDLALAQHIFTDDDQPHWGILPTPWGVRALPAPVVRRALAHVRELWAEDVTCEDDQQLQFLIKRLLGRTRERAPADCRRHALSNGHRARRMLEQVRATGLQFGASAERAVPYGAAYLNVGQIGLAVPFFHHWLGRRPDIACTIMLHDVIPLEHPDLVMPGSVAHHARMVETAAQRAHGLLFNTASARDSVNFALRQFGRTQVPSFVRSLPLASAYTEVQASLPQLENTHYFVAVSTVEPRKNYELLFDVWARLVNRFGASAPHLVIVGSPGYRSDAILARLVNSPKLHSRVHHVSGLSSPGLAALVLGAAGMLSPSFAEGFGLPVLEANALGVPTIASDIAAHREVANRATKLLPTADAGRWEQAILAVPRSFPRKRPFIEQQHTERAYCQDVVRFACSGSGSSVHVSSSAAAFVAA